MHIQTHVMSGWCIANCFNLTSRERMLSMLAASLPDLDGITWFFGEEMFWATHHVYAHNFLFALVLSGLLTIFSNHKWKCFFLFLALIHLHFLMDLLGSGEGWNIPYFLPFDDYGYTLSCGWEFDSMENKLAGLFFLIWCILIIFRKKRTPLEYFMPRLDSQIVLLAEKREKQF